MLDNIIILVGGYGKRLGEITKKTPKPLIKFNGKPFLDLLMNELTNLKPKKIILLCSYKKKFFIKRYKNKFNNIIIKCILEKKPLGTGGAIFNARKYIKKKTLICNGDTFFKVGKNFSKKIRYNNYPIKMFITKNNNYKSNKKLNSLAIFNKKINFSQKSKYMNSGIYLVNNKIIKYLPNKICSFENDIINNLIQKGLVLGDIYSGPHLDIGTKKNLKLFSHILKK